MSGRYHVARKLHPIGATITPTPLHERRVSPGDDTWNDVAYERCVEIQDLLEKHRPDNVQASRLHSIFYTLQRRPYGLGLKYKYGYLHRIETFGVQAGPFDLTWIGVLEADGKEASDFPEDQRSEIQVRQDILKFCTASGVAELYWSGCPVKKGCETWEFFCMSATVVAHECDGKPVPTEEKEWHKKFGNAA